MRKRKWFTLLLAVVMLSLSFAGCGSSTAETQSAAPAESPAAPADAAEPSAAAPAGEAPAANTEPYEVVIVNASSATQNAMDLVGEKMTEIAMEKIGNTSVKLVYLSEGTYTDQLNMMLASGEQVDICLCAITDAASIAFMKNANQLLPLDDLLANYGQDIVANTPEEWLKAGRFGNEQYSIPGDRGKGSGIGFFMVKEIADALAIDMTAITDYASIEAALVKVKEAYPDMYPLAPDGGGYNPMPVAFDPTYGYIGCIPDIYKYQDGDRLANYYETEEYKTWVTVMYDWMQKGLVMPDGANSTVSNKSLMAAGKVACAIRNTDPDPEGEWSDAAGKPILCQELLDPVLYAATYHAGWQAGIGSTSQNPERAMQVMNLLSADVDFANLLCYGVEGTHYQVTDEAKDTIEYMPGQDGTSTEYPTIWGRFPQGFDIHVPFGRPDNFWQIVDEFNAACVYSPAYGFSYDASNVQNELAACANVVDKYNAPLQCGMLDPTTELPKFIEELKAAGSDAIIADKQAQFDAWLEVTGA